MFIRRAAKIEGNNAISELIPIKVGGIEQWIYIRGQNKHHPILLMLHGGPGTAQIGFIRQFQEELERHFVVVQWDQRGAGLSYSKHIPPESMRIEQFVQDAVKVTKYILQHLNQEQLYLVGHSWGTIIGLLTIHKAPDLFKRYFGVAQVSHVKASELLSYNKLLEITQAEHNEKAYKELDKIGPPPWNHLKQDRIHQKYVERLGGGITRDGKMIRKILLKLLMSKEYTFRDFTRFIQGQFFSMNHLQDEMEQIDLRKKIDSVKIPINFLMGKHDLMIPYETTKSFFDKIKAPEKQWFLFKHSAHTPFLEEPDKFMDILLSETNKDEVLTNELDDVSSER